jgi:hypothetical protein
VRRFTLRSVSSLPGPRLRAEGRHSLAHAGLPDEAGFADADYTFWIGLFAPTTAMQRASLWERLHALGVTPMIMTSGSSMPS